MAHFERAIDKTLAWEGGYVNDPKDPGGETKYGISKRAIQMWIKKSFTRKEPVLSTKSITGILYQQIR